MKAIKELVVLSGKGGTGKTSISGALAKLSTNKVLADCDVDAANFHLILPHKIVEKHEFLAGFEPAIDQQLCNNCGRCTEVCHYHAIADGVITDPLRCEGCGVCSQQCPEHAISMREKHAGYWLLADTPHGSLVYADLNLAVESSGKLVAKVREQAQILAAKQHKSLIITDGPPGIGCPAIATLTGASLALVVVEPTQSGIHDMERVVTLAGHFKIPVAVCINKATLNLDNSRNVRRWCEQRQLPVVGELPFSEVFVETVKQNKTVLDVDEPALFQPLQTMWFRLASLLNVTNIGGR